MKISKDARRAILLGGMCSISYLAVYLARNVLSTVSPAMIKNGVMDTRQIGTLSSVYFITYAVGQLVNGFIGDKIKAKYMISFGLMLASICFLVFPHVTATPAFFYTAYGATGFFLSMIYGPMTKVVAENTDPIYATRCSLGYTFSSFFGSPLAGLLAAFLTWYSMFLTGSSVLLVMGLVCYFVFTAFERRGIVKYNKFRIPKAEGGSIKLLIERDIVRFSFIAIITGVVRTSVVFWLPTYISQYLGYSTEKSALIFTVATAVISTTTFITVFVYECLGRNMELTIRLAFILSATFFLLAFLFNHPVLNIIFMVGAIMCSNAADSMMWSRYCPSLLDTGMVSTATGFLDFLSYMAAAAASSLFANAVYSIGWGPLILIWLALMIVGILVMLPLKQIAAKCKKA